MPWPCLLTAAGGIVSLQEQRPDIYGSHKQQASFRISHSSEQEITVKMDP